MSENCCDIVVDFGKGCVPSKKDIRDYRLNKKVCHASNLPEMFSVEHSKIKNQQSVGSCVAHSTAEIVEQLHNDGIAQSTAWVYGYRPFGYFQGEGMMPCNALKTVTKMGCIKYDDCPGNFEIPEAKNYISKNIEKYKKEASQDKMASYARLHNYNDIKEAIYKTGKPVLVCIRTQGLKLDENYIAQIPPIFVTGGHAVVCYGWNETGLLIQNSWGEGWGNKGCFILPYAYGFTEAWVLTKDEEVVAKPFAFALREALVKVIRAIGDFLVKIFVKSDKKF